MIWRVAIAWCLAAGLTLVGTPAQAGVRWTPEISSSVSYYLDGLNRSVTRVRLSAPSLREKSLVEQVQARGSSTWSRTGRRVELGRDGRAVVRIRAVDQGSRYRYVSPASGARSWSSSSPARIRLTPARLQLNTEGVTLHDVGDGTTASIVFEAVAGQRLGFAAGGEEPEGQGTELAFRVSAPDGTLWWDYDTINEIPDDNRIMRWVAPQTGEYHLKVRSRVDDAHPVLSAVTVWASTPKVVQLTRDMMASPALFPPPTVKADYPGQAVEVHYPAEAGELISVGYSEERYRHHTFLTANGTATWPWYYNRIHTGSIIHSVVARVAGEQIYRMTPSDNVPLDGLDLTVRSPADVATASIDGGPVEVERPDPETVSVVEFAGVAGDRVDITSCGTCRVFDPDSLRIGTGDFEYRLGWTGTYRIVVFPDESSASDVRVEVTRHQGE